MDGQEDLALATLGRAVGRERILIVAVDAWASLVPKLGAVVVLTAVVGVVEGITNDIVFLFDVSAKYLNWWPLAEFSAVEVVLVLNELLLEVQRRRNRH